MVSINRVKTESTCFSLSIKKEQNCYCSMQKKFHSRTHQSTLESNLTGNSHGAPSLATWENKAIRKMAIMKKLWQKMGSQQNPDPGINRLRPASHGICLHCLDHSCQKQHIQADRNPELWPTHHYRRPQNYSNSSTWDRSNGPPWIGEEKLLRQVEKMKTPVSPTTLQTPGAHQEQHQEAKHQPPFKMFQHQRKCTKYKTKYIKNLPQAKILKMKKVGWAKSRKKRRQKEQHN